MAGWVWTGRVGSASDTAGHRQFLLGVRSAPAVAPDEKVVAIEEFDRYW